MTVTYDSKYTLETPYKSGYSFNYWSYNGTKFESSGTWKIASNITLLANYEVKNYSISYDLNTGYIESTKNNPTQYNILTDDFTLINPKKDNYTFSGWTGTDLSEETKNVTIKKGSYGDREYKAHYESTITLKGYNESKTMKVKYNESYTIEKPTRDGYEFDHWYYYEGSKQVTIESSGTWKYPGNITLTATFVKKYTITYYLDGGSFPSGTEVKNEYTMNTETFKIPAVTKEGYKFLGWSGSDINDKVQEITIVKGSEGDRVFYANFEACEYNVTLSYPDGTSEDFQIKYNEHYLINNPKVDDGYQFEYWYYKDGSKEIKIESTGNWTIAHDVTLYAKVTKIESN